MILEQITDYIVGGHLLSAFVGAGLALLLPWLFKGRRLSCKILYSRHEFIDGIGGIAVTVSIYNPSSNIASLYKFRALKRDGKIDLTPPRAGQQDVILYCANRNIPVEDVTYITPHEVYPLKIFFPIHAHYLSQEWRTPYHSLTFQSKSLGIVKSKIQNICTNMDQEYEIKIDPRIKEKVTLDKDTID